MKGPDSLSTLSTLSTLKRLQEKARQGSSATRNGKTRLAVQVGHCSQSVGAAAVAGALKDSLPEDAYMVVAGCDGACFAAPQVLLTDPAGIQHRFTRVTVESARSIAIESSKGTPSGLFHEKDFFARQRRLTLDRCGELESTEIDDYLLNGGYVALAHALTMSPEDVIEEVKASGASRPRWGVLSRCRQVAGRQERGEKPPIPGSEL